jgi:hypothetical protein
MREALLCSHFCAYLIDLHQNFRHPLVCYSIWEYTSYGNETTVSVPNFRNTHSLNLQYHPLSIFTLLVVFGELRIETKICFRYFSYSACFVDIAVRPVLFYDRSCFRASFYVFYC